MRRPFPIALLLLALALLAGALSACGAEEETSVIEGEPLELDGLLYNVQLTRFLNPADVEDAAYLEGQKAPPKGKQYLGVFMRIKNDREDPAVPSAQFEIRDTRDTTYQPVDSESEFALDVAEPIPPDQETPVPDSPAASGPIKGGMILFLIDETSIENRPLQLEVHYGSDVGEVELDI
jgi:hypothetical protein